MHKPSLSVTHCRYSYLANLKELYTEQISAGTGSCSTLRSKCIKLCTQG